MQIVDIILKKRYGRTLTNEEIRELIIAYTNDQIPDYQMAAWLMAVCFQGMTSSETAALTMAMARSGKMVNLNAVPGIKVDKHSTGGVADTITLILAPLVAAAGVPVAKMSGRGLGFTGGTIDKMDAIPGMRSTLSEEEFIAILQRHNLAVTGQTPDIAPADGKMYALRDVTGTVDSIPLIASSIMSKKLAAGADKIVLDVKVGSGAFMRNFVDAVKLAETMVEIGELVGRQTMAVITNMDEPLGKAVGNSLEVSEAIDTLQGQGSIALRQVCLTLGSYMLVMAGIATDIINGQQILTKLIDNKAALQKFKDFIAAQGGNPAIVERRTLLPQAKYQAVITSATNGYIQTINAAQIGYSAMRLGAGRMHKGQQIDLAAGLELACRVGDYIEAGQPIVTLYANEQHKIAEVTGFISEAIVLGDVIVSQNQIILGVVDKNGFRKI